MLIYSCLTLITLHVPKPAILKIKEPLAVDKSRLSWDEIGSYLR